MIGGFSTPKKDEAIKVSGGQAVKACQVLCRGVNRYKAGENVRGRSTLYSACAGKVYFTKKKTSARKATTFINVEPCA
ncbi:MAG: hypothetical protein C4540_03525 [Candidatus Omnitrophota bacterium]|jgi:ribosomal protein L27|nr:MAG: hypothetical protein C4540_03525 [Candidatus Omnitrophota bacterium]